MRVEAVQHLRALAQRTRLISACSLLSGQPESSPLPPSCMSALLGPTATAGETIGAGVLALALKHAGCTTVFGVVGIPIIEVRGSSEQKEKARDPRPGTSRYNGDQTQLTTERKMNVTASRTSRLTLLPA